MIAIPRSDYASEFLRMKRIPHSVKPAATFQEAADLVMQGQADALIGDEQTVLYYLYSRGLGSRLKRVGEPLYEGKYCFGVKEGNRILRGILEKGLSMARERGVLDSLQAKWTGTYFPKTAEIYSGTPLRFSFCWLCFSPLCCSHCLGTVRSAERRKNAILSSRMKSANTRGHASL